MAVLFDIQGTQSREHGERGIARYLLGLAGALEQQHSDVVSRYVLNPDMPEPEAVSAALTRDRLAWSDQCDTASTDVYHIGSPFELKVPIDRVWPPAVRQDGLRLAVTLYDLIPAIFSDVYLHGAETRRAYQTRLELVRRADRILAISEATAADAIERLRVPAERAVVVGTGVSPQFQPPRHREDAVAAISRSLPWVQPGFVLYTGGFDFRKNIDRLLVAYASLPRQLRARHQLIIVCEIPPAVRSDLSHRLEELGIGRTVRLPGFVPDNDLILLYQAAELFVFPSLYEGFGLPVAEAMACGAPVIASRSSSIKELVTDEAALFDPHNPRAIRDALEAGLTDTELQARLRAKKLAERHTWREVARRTAATYEELERMQRRPRRTKGRVGFISPLPPQQTGVAVYSYRLLNELVKHCDVDAFVEANVHPLEGVTPVHVFRFDTAERARAGYQRTVYAIGNSGFHARALKLLRQRPGIVMAHDVRLSGLYALCSREWPDMEPRGFHGALQAMYGDRVPTSLGERGYLTLDEQERYGIVMAREVISAAEKYIVHSEHAAAMARRDSAPEDAGKIIVLPFAFPEYPEITGTDRPSRPVVATFGISALQKQTDKIIKAFAEIAAEVPADFAIVGRPVNVSVEQELDLLATELGVAERIQFTGDVDDETYQSWLGRTTVAVQLRDTSNGESSAAVADCFGAGIPTIVSDLGWAQELPDDTVVKVDREISPAALASEIVGLLEDPGRLDALRRAALTHAQQNSFTHAAHRLAAMLEVL